jgi:hypothetical protein
MNPESAVENPLPSEAQSLRREDNALLPLSGVGSAVFYEPSLPPQQRIAQRAKRLCRCTLGCLHDSRIVPAVLRQVATAESGLKLVASRLERHLPERPKSFPTVAEPVHLAALHRQESQLFCNRFVESKSER